MKLSRGKLLETIRRKNEGWTSYQVRKIAGVSVRRVNQIWHEYVVSGELPEIGKKAGRPSRKISDEEVLLVEKVYAEYRVSATTLEPIIQRDYGLHIPHNRIHKVLLMRGLAKRKSKKDVRKKEYIRYERRHSLTAVHIDWHYTVTRLWVFVVIDDASRKLLALIECGNPTTKESIRGMQIALVHGRIKQCISDHGSQFTTNFLNGNSTFKAFLNATGIKQILCRIKHPQSNGKVEKWFETYDRHRHAFRTIEEFTYWYNVKRPHRSLKFDILETPHIAFERKLKAEA